MSLTLFGGAAVTTACQSTGTAYRFKIPLTSAMRGQYPDAVIYMYGDSPVGAGNLQLDHSGSFRVPVNIPTAAPSISVPAISSNGSYAVSWGSVSGAASYTLQQQAGGGAWATLQTGSGTSKALSGQYSDTYGYRVQGCNAGGCSGWSANSYITVQGDPGLMAAPPAESSSAQAVPGE